MCQIGAVILYRNKEVLHRSLNAASTTGSSGESYQSCQRSVQDRFVRGFEDLTNQPIDFFAYSSAFEPACATAVLDLELLNQVKMAKLKRPSFVFGDFLHAI